MGRINVVTSFSPKGYETYGRPMLKSFAWGWPPLGVDLYVYHENSIPIDASPRANWVNLDRDQDRQEFMATHTDRPRDHPHAYLQWPVKFCHKVFAVTSAPRDCDWLIWLDGDIETTKPITHEFLNSVLPDDDTVGVYLGRRWWSHTETGFYAIRMNDVGKQFLDALREVYTSDKIMSFTNLTDCAAFDYCVQIFEGVGHKFKNLGEKHKGPDIEVLGNSVLAPYLWHNKGDFRKLKAYGAVA